MKEYKMTKDEKEQISDAINKIWKILCGLPSPRAAASAVAGAHVILLEEDGTTEATVRAKMKDVENFVVESWAKRHLRYMSEEELRRKMENEAGGKLYN